MVKWGGWLRDTTHICSAGGIASKTDVRNAERLSIRPDPGIRVQDRPKNYEFTCLIAIVVRGRKEFLSNLVFEVSGSCGDLVGLCGFNSVFEFDACDDFGQIVKAA